MIAADGVWMAKTGDFSDINLSPDKANPTPTAP